MYYRFIKNVIINKEYSYLVSINKDKIRKIENLQQSYNKVTIEFTNSKILR